MSLPSALPSHHAAAMSNMSQQQSWLRGLNAPQRAAVEHGEGPLLVLAGAGTGKTRVLTSRIAFLMNRDRLYDNQWLAVTFTNKAAQEMKHRLANMLQRPVEGSWLGTFHSLSLRMLRRHGEAVGLHSDFTILDADDQLRLIRQILQAANIDEKKTPPRMVMAIISRWKDKGLLPEQVQEHDKIMVRLYQHYQQRLAQLNACDFGDLMLHGVNLLAQNPEILQRYGENFRYILVDEYQDTNAVQYRWLSLLASNHHNICCVGDDDQSIYGWRGAEIENILRFEKDFPGAVTIRLEQNYRSSQHILSAAGGLIAHNQGRLGKTLWTEDPHGVPVQLQITSDSTEEARFVGDEIEKLEKQGVSLNHIAVLVRAGYQMREFEERFIHIGLPYRVIGGPRFYERQEIKDALGYLRLIRNKADDISFERVINVPRRGIGATTLQQLHMVARERGISLYDAAASMCEEGTIGTRAGKPIRQFLQQLEMWRQKSANLSLKDLLQMVLDESGYTAMWQQEKTPEAEGRLENLKEMSAFMADFPSLTDFLEHVALVSEVEKGDQTRAQVSIMSLHGAKGLEFDAVFLPGWEEGVFPSQKSLDENGLKGVEEERRLAYVGLTRAKKLAYVSMARRRRTYGYWGDSIPSRFVMELPEKHIERRKEITASYGSGFSSGFWQNDKIDDDYEEGAKIYTPSNAPNPFMSGNSGSSWQKSPPRPLRSSARAVDVEPRPTPAAVRPQTSMRLGERVFHEKYGYGVVVVLDKDKAEIDFGDSGVKKIMLGYLKKG
ncbi:MAG: ATP-dependent helicase [Alphaproteobacteria bacterium]